MVVGACPHFAAVNTFVRVGFLNGIHDPMGRVKNVLAKVKLHGMNLFTERRADGKEGLFHGLQDTVHGHGAVVEVAEHFHLIIDLGHGDSIQNGLVDIGDGSSEALRILVRVNQVEGSKVVCTALLAGAGLPFTDSYDFGLNSP